MYDFDDETYDRFLTRLPHGRGWKLIGTVPVDAGCLVVIDPCYLVSNANTGGSNIDPYEEIIADDNRLNEDGYQSIGLDSGVVFSTGYGDGTYPVFARIEDGRVMEVRVIMD